MNWLSFGILFAAIIGLISGDIRDNQKYQLVRKKCQGDPATRLDEETLKTAFKGDVEISKFGPHAICIYTLLGVLDKDFNVNKVELKKNLNYIITDAKKLDDVVNECGVKKGSPEETAVEIFKCSRNAMAPYLGY